MTSNKSKIIKRPSIFKINLKNSLLKSIIFRKKGKIIVISRSINKYRMAILKNWTQKPPNDLVKESKPHSYVANLSLKIFLLPRKEERERQRKIIIIIKNNNDQNRNSKIIDNKPLRFFPYLQYDVFKINYINFSL